MSFQDIKWNYTQKAVNFSEFLEKFHQICWVSGNDFHLQMAPGVKKPLGITQRKKNSSEIYKIWKNSGVFWKILNYFCCFQDIKWNYTQKAVNFQFFFNSWQWFSPSWCQVFQWNYTQKCIFSKSHKFFKNLMTSDDKWWWVMMSDDEWWWVMRSDDEG